MRKEPKLTQERLRELLSYDSGTGVFTCVKTRKGVAVGDVAGSIKGANDPKGGYRRIWLDSHCYQAASLAWFWVHGEWPARNLQFSDGNRDNAAIANLAFGEVDQNDRASRNAYDRRYRAANPEKRRAWQRKGWYGVTQADYERMLLDQNGVCACCHKPETQFHNGNPLPLCVDHCHEGSGVRGLLCRHCNNMLGHAKDNPETLDRAASYLRAHAEKPKTNVIPLAGRRVGQS